MGHQAGKNPTLRVHLTVEAVESVLGQTGVNLAMLDHGRLSWVAELTDDPARLVEVLRVACEPDASPDEFASRFDLDGLLSAAESLALAAADFFPTGERDEPGDEDEGQDEPAPRIVDGLQVAWDCAGILGVDPRPLTLRRLWQMAKARQRSDWARAAWMTSALINTIGTPKKPLSPEQLIPRVFRAPKEPEPELTEEEEAEARADFWSTVDRVSTGGTK